MFKHMTGIAIIDYISTWQKYRQCKRKESEMAERVRIITITVAGESVSDSIHLKFHWSMIT